MKPFVSIIIPAFNEAENLPELYRRIQQAAEAMDCQWELILVDDHSKDGTFAAIKELSSQDPHVRGYRLSRNFGSHKAIVCGLENARGNCAAVMAADLQDPPEILGDMILRWQKGAQVVWAVREERQGESALNVGFARLYYFTMRHLLGMRELPPEGADCFLIDKLVIQALGEFKETHMSLFLLLTWLGFRQEKIGYVKQGRAKGRSGWTLAKKIKLVVDSVTAFSYLPIRLISLLGFLISLVGFIYAVIVIANVMVGHPAQGWSSMMVVILVFGGIQMLMMGLLGEYLWRALDESRRRPRYVIEDSTSAEVLASSEDFLSRIAASRQPFKPS